jgi:outer membrane immunogenic protein
MRRFQCALLATVAAIGFASVASAADLPTKGPYYKAPVAAPAFSWTGFYIGGDVGYGWGTSDGTLTNSAGTFPVPYNADPNGIIGGGFLGYNYQINQFVVGVEADWQAADLTGSASSAGYTMSTRVNDYGSLRGRLGYAMDRWLVFATGGWAWGKASTSYALTGAAPFFTNTFTGNGWTAGGGVEYAITNNWLARIEYRYTDLGSHSYIDVPSNSGETGNRVTVNDVRLGVAYKF